MKRKMGEQTQRKQYSFGGKFGAPADIAILKIKIYGTGLTGGYRTAPGHGLLLKPFSVSLQNTLTVPVFQI